MIAKTDDLLVMDGVDDTLDDYEEDFFEGIHFANLKVNEDCGMVR